MTSRESTSFLDAFEPPEGLTGHTAIFVTMSADTDVLEAVLTRFTGLAGSARARLGRRHAFLLRDANSTESRVDVLAPNEVPGLIELRPRLSQGWPRLLHAKVALLAFARPGAAKASVVRLVVTTGNFTRATLNRQLELMFVTTASLDLDRDRDTDAEAEARADVGAAGEFVRALANAHFQAKVAELRRERGPLDAFDELLAALARMNLKGKELPESRFFHSLDVPLLPQLKERARVQVASKRNLLLAGSGFFEREIDGANVPSVLQEIASFECFAKHTRRILMVPPETSGQLRGWARTCSSGDETELAESASGWERPIRASDPHSARGDRRGDRRLHAKFVLFARTTEDLENFTGAHLYLGSGNLSVRGMVSPRTNIECGVFFDLAERLTAEDLKQDLFWDRGAAPIRDDEWVDLPPEEGDRALGLIACCPILFARVDDDGLVTLVWDDEDREESLLLHRDGHPAATVSRAPSDPPLHVAIIPASFRVTTIDGSKEWHIAVSDTLGRYAWPRDRIRSFDELVLAIREDPTAPDDPDAADAIDDEDDDRAPVTRATNAPRATERRYPMLEMARFLEEMARKQQSLAPEQIDAWLDQLERTRDRPIDGAFLDAWRAAPVELFTHLSNAAFAPRGMTKRQRIRHGALVASLASAWSLR